MKKRLTLLICLFVLTATFSGFGQALDDVRDMVGPAPGLNRIITERLYRDTVRLKDLQWMSGTLVAQSKLPGTSAAITEKAVTFNAGTRIFAGNKLFGDGTVRRFSVQGIVTGQSEEGFVSIFKGDAYQRTLGAGFSFNWFFFGPLGDRSQTFYTAVTGATDSLRLQLREEISLYLATNCSKVSKPVEQSGLALYGLLAQQPKLFNLLRDPEAVLDSCSSKDANAVQRAALRGQYNDLVKALQYLLPADCKSWPAAGAATWVNANLSSAAKIQALQRGKQYKQFIQHLDSLQLAKVKWKHRQLRWLSFKVLENTEQQPIYDPNEALLMRKAHYAFEDVRLSVNNAHVWRQVRFFHSEGIGFNSQRSFKPDNQLTYQRSISKNVGPANTPTVVVEESKFYAEAPTKPAYTVFDGQASVFWTKMRLGLDGTVKYKWDKNAPDQTSATLGLFLPVVAGESAINFMVQTKWDTLTDWTVGFNLSASIPGFLTSAKK